MCVHDYERPSTLRGETWTEGDRVLGEGYREGGGCAREDMVHLVNEGYAGGGGGGAGGAEGWAGWVDRGRVGRRGRWTNRVGGEVG